MARFPALYRMPIAYVLGSIGALGLLASDRIGRRVGPADSPSPSEATAASPSSSTPRPGPKPVAGEAAGDVSDAVLRTADGLRRKVVVRELDVVPRKKPDGLALSGRPLDYFAIRFVYGETPAMIQVGPRSGAPEGWVPRPSVLEWDTRLMARPTPRATRPTLAIYPEESCLVAALAGQVCRRHAGRCPTSGEESAEDGPEGFLGWPILRSRGIAGRDGTTRTIFEVASLVADRAPPAPSGLGDLGPAIRHVYVAFAIDTTSSMQASIDAAKALATNLAADVSRRYGDVTLHLALVEYRDESPNFGFKARVVTPFTNPVGFPGIIGTIAAANRGDGTVDEAVLDGLALALPGAVGGLEWPTGRSGELATKLLVLLGDAPDHDRDLDRARTLADRARESGISIAAVALDRPGSLSRDEKARFEAQWTCLAEGSYRPRDRSRGFAEPLAPLLVRVDQAAALGPSLRALIDDRVAQAKDLAALAAAEAERSLEQYVNSRGLTLAQVAPVLVDLHRGEADPVARPDPRLNGRKAPSIRSGWIAEKVGDVRQVDVEILMTRAELDSLIAELTQVQQAAAGAAGELSDLLAIGNAAATGEGSFLAADRGSQTFADHLRRRRNLPPARPDSLLARTQADLLRADALDRTALEGRVRAALVGLIRRRNAPDWSDPRRMVESMATVRYDLIDF